MMSSRRNSYLASNDILKSARNESAMISPMSGGFSRRFSNVMGGLKSPSPKRAGKLKSPFGLKVNRPSMPKIVQSPILKQSIGNNRVDEART